VAGAHALMRGDDVVKVVKPARVAGGFVKGLCVSKDLALSLVTKTLIGSLDHPLSLVAYEVGGVGHTYSSIVTTTYEFLCEPNNVSRFFHQ